MKTKLPTTLFLAGLALICAACTPTAPAAEELPASTDTANPNSVVAPAEQGAVIDHVQVGKNYIHYTVSNRTNTTISIDSDAFRVVLTDASGRETELKEIVKVVTKYTPDNGYGPARGRIILPGESVQLGKHINRLGNKGIGPKDVPALLEKAVSLRIVYSISEIYADRLRQGTPNAYIPVRMESPVLNLQGHKPKH